MSIEERAHGIRDRADGPRCAVPAMQHLEGHRMHSALRSFSPSIASFVSFVGGIAASPRIPSPVAWALLIAVVAIAVLIVGAGGVYALCAVTGRDPGPGGRWLFAVVQAVLRWPIAPGAAVLRHASHTDRVNQGPDPC
jgi:hypothetical protein